MQMGPGGAARSCRQRPCAAPAATRCTGLHVDRAQMAVHADQTAAVIDEHRVAVEKIIRPCRRPCRRSARRPACRVGAAMSMPLCGLRDSPLNIRRMPNELLRTPGDGLRQAQASGGGIASSGSSACSMRIFSRLTRARSAFGQIDLARRDLEGLAGVLLVADREFELLPASASLRTITCRAPQRRRQRDADHRHPCRPSCDHQCAVAVDFDIGHGAAGSSSRKILTPPGTATLVRQIEALAAPRRSDHEQACRRRDDANAVRIMPCPRPWRERCPGRAALR